MADNLPETSMYLSGALRDFAVYSTRHTCTEPSEDTEAMLWLSLQAVQPSILPPWQHTNFSFYSTSKTGIAGIMKSRRAIYTMSESRLDS